MVKNLPEDETICPFCKLMVDTGDAYSAYRKISDYGEHKYPEWTFPEGKDLNAHLINFHRLPEKLTTKMVALFALWMIQKEHPDLTVSIPTDFFTTTL